jgi:hypothetical protein
VHTDGDEWREFENEVILEIICHAILVEGRISSADNPQPIPRRGEKALILEYYNKLLP